METVLNKSVVCSLHYILGLQHLTPVCSLQSSSVLPSVCPVSGLRFTLTGHLSMYLNNELSKLDLGSDSAKATATDGNVLIFYFALTKTIAVLLLRC